MHDCRQIDETVETAAQNASEQQYDFVPIRQLKQQTAQQSDARADILQTDGKVYGERRISEKSMNTCQSQSTILQIMCSKLLVSNTYVNSSLANDGNEKSGQHGADDRTHIVDGHHGEYHWRQIASAVIVQLIQAPQNLEASHHQQDKARSNRIYLALISVDQSTKPKALKTSMLRFGRRRIRSGGGRHGGRIQCNRNLLRCTRFYYIRCGGHLTFDAHDYDLIDAFEIIIVVVFVIVVVVIIVGNIVINVTTYVRFCIDFFFVLIGIFIDFAIFLCTFSDRRSSAAHRSHWTQSISMHSLNGHVHALSPTIFGYSVSQRLTRNQHRIGNYTNALNNTERRTKKN